VGTGGLTDTQIFRATTPERWDGKKDHSGRVGIGITTDPAWVSMG
jgi:hypothetical protein